MSLVARLVDVDRADRVPVARPGTLRGASQAAVDVIIDNLSSTGFLMRSADVMELDALVSLGIPGIGIHAARVSRVQAPYYGCSFVTPIHEDQIAAALSADTVLRGLFDPVDPPQPSSEIRDAEAISKLPLRSRLALIVGTSAALWALLIGTVALIDR